MQNQEQLKNALKQSIPDYDDEDINPLYQQLKKNCFYMMEYMKNNKLSPKQVKSVIDKLSKNSQIVKKLGNEFLILCLFNKINAYYTIANRNIWITFQELKQFHQEKKIDNLRSYIKNIENRLKQEESYVEDFMEEVKKDESFQKLKQQWEAQPFKQKIDPKKENPLNPQNKPTQQNTELTEDKDTSKEYLNERTKELEEDINAMPINILERKLFQAIKKFYSLKLQILEKQPINEWKEDLTNITKDLLQSIQKSQRDNLQIKKTLQEFKGSQNIDDALSGLIKLKEQLIPLDICQLIRLIDRTELAKKKVKDKEIVLFIGTSGAGKTTIMLKMLNYTLFQGKSNGLTTLMPKQPLKEEHKQLKSGPQSKSITRYIFAEKLPKQSFKSGRDKQLYICDSPGFGDSASVEVDIANGVGMINAIYGCKSVLPIIILSAKNWGDRAQGPKIVGKIITQLFYNYEDVQQNIAIIFNKFSQKQFKQLGKKCKDLLQNLNESESANSKFKAYAGNLVDIAKDLTESDIFNPLTLDVKAITQKYILKKKPIMNPRQNFKYSFTDSTIKTIKTMIQSLERQVLNALKLGEYSFVNYYLKNLKNLGDYVYSSGATENYEKLVKLIDKQIVDTAASIEYILINKIMNSLRVPSEEITTDINQKRKKLQNYKQIEFLKTVAINCQKNVANCLQKCMNQLFDKSVNQTGEGFSEIVKVSKYFGQNYFPHRKNQIQDTVNRRYTNIKRKVNNAFQDKNYQGIQGILNELINVSIAISQDKKQEQTLFITQQIKNTYIKKEEYLNKILNPKNIKQDEIARIDLKDAKEINQCFESIQTIQNIPHFGRIAQEQDFQVNKKSLIKLLSQKIERMTNSIYKIVNEQDQQLDDNVVKVIRVCKDNLLKLMQEVQYVKEERASQINNCFESLKSFIKRQQDCINELLSALRARDLIRIENSLLNIRQIIEKVQKLSQFGSRKEQTQSDLGLREILKREIINYLSNFNAQKAVFPNINASISKTKQIQIFECVMELHPQIRQKIEDLKKSMSDNILKPLIEIENQKKKLDQNKANPNLDWIQTFRQFVLKLDRFISNIASINNNGGVNGTNLMERMNQIQQNIFKYVANELTKMCSEIVERFTALHQYKNKQIENQSEQSNEKNERSFRDNIKEVRKRLGLLSYFEEHSQLQQCIKPYIQLNVEVQPIHIIINTILRSLEDQFENSRQNNQVDLLVKIEGKVRGLRQIDSDIKKKYGKDIFTQLYQRVAEDRKTRSKDLFMLAMGCIVNDEIDDYERLRSYLLDMRRIQTTQGRQKCKQVQSKLGTVLRKTANRVRESTSKMQFVFRFGEEQIRFITELEKAHEMRNQLKDILSNETISQSLLQEAAQSIQNSFFEEFNDIKNEIDEFNFKDTPARIRFYAGAQRVIIVNTEKNFIQRYQKKLEQKLDNMDKIDAKNLSQKLTIYLQNQKRTVYKKFLTCDTNLFQIEENFEKFYDKVEESQKRELDERVSNYFERLIQQFSQSYASNLIQANQKEKNIKDRLSMLPIKMKKQIQENFKKQKANINKKQTQERQELQNKFKDGSYSINDIVNIIKRAYDSNNNLMLTQMLNFFDKHFQKGIKEMALNQKLIDITNNYFWLFVKEHRQQLQKNHKLKESYERHEDAIIKKYLGFIQSSIRQKNKNMDFQTKSIISENDDKTSTTSENKKVKIDQLFKIYDQILQNKDKFLKEGYKEIISKLEDFCEEIKEDYIEKIGRFDPINLTTVVPDDPRRIERIINDCDCINKVYKQCEGAIRTLRQKTPRMQRIQEDMRANLVNFDSKSQQFVERMKYILVQVQSIQFYDDMIRSQNDRYYEEIIEDHEKFLKILECMENPFKRNFKEKAKSYKKDDYTNIAADRLKQHIIEEEKEIKNSFETLECEISPKFNVITKFIEIISKKNRNYIKITKQQKEKLPLAVKQQSKKLNEKIQKSIQEFHKQQEKIKKQINKLEDEKKTQINDIKQEIYQKEKKKIQQLKEGKKKLIDTAKTEQQKKKILDQLQTDLKTLKNQFKVEKKMEFQKIEKIFQQAKVKFDNIRKKNMQDIGKKLMIAKKIALNLHYEKKDNIQKMNEHLNKFKEKLGNKKVGDLFVYLNNEQSPYAGMIAVDQPIFQGAMARRFNNQIENKGIEYVLQNLKNCVKQAELTNLRTRFQDYKKVFNEKLSLYKRNPTKDFVDTLVNEIEIIGKEIKKSYQDGKGHDDKVKLIGLIFSLWTIIKANVQNEEVQYTYEPHPAQIITIFLLLGLGYTKAYQVIKNRMAEVGTGEGKSVILAGLSSYLAVVGYKVCCACYSSYLSGRDRQAFEDLFMKLKISNKIVYGTLNEHCENVLNSNKKQIFREGVMEALVKQGEDISQEVKKLLSGQVFKDKKKNENSEKSILLIDEVDVFFNKSFFGSLYVPSISLDCYETKQLISYIWKELRTDPNLNIETIKSSKQYNQVIKKYASIKNIIENQIHGMLSAAKNYQHAYLIVDNKIMYKQQDSVSDKISYGFKTVFANCCQHDKGTISQESFQRSQKITLAIAEFSYAMLPNYFEAILGVTGTLSVMSKFKKQSLKDTYKVEEQFIIPSVYGSLSGRKINYNVVPDQEFYKKIVEEIEEIHKQERPIIVFFKSILDVYNFFISQQFKQFRSKAIVLNEQHDVDTRNQTIKRAPQKSQINILTSSFGRGTDFVVYDKSVLQKGGVHVIHSFVTVDESQEIQIKGRTARQGKPGSYKAILKLSELQRLGIKTMDSVDSEEKIYTCIKTQRERLEDQMCLQIQKGLKSANKCHDESIAMYNQNITQQKLVEYVAKLNRFPQIKNKTVKTVLALDATGSMSHALQKVLNILDNVFTRTYVVLKKRKVQGTFDLKIVVYRNYNSESDKILQYSPFQNKPQKLKSFLSKVKSEGGQGNEAVEVAINHINQLIKPQNGEVKVDQIIIIGDIGANTAQETKVKRNQKGENYWISKGFKPTEFNKQLQEIKQKKIPIHSFYIGTKAENFFKRISQSTQGDSQEFRINQQDAAEKLTAFIVTKILKILGGQKGEELVQQYRKMYQ